MSEKAAFKVLKTYLPVGYDRIERIENFVGVGTPDVNYCIDGVEGWIEMKSPIEPRKKNSLLFGGNHKLSQDQKNWFLKQKNAGGIGFIYIATDKQYILIDGTLYADCVNNSTLQMLLEKSAWCAPKPAAKEEWCELRKVLRGAR